MFYAVHKGIIPGIYDTWDKTKKQIYKFKGAKYKKFESYEDAKIYVRTGIVKATLQKINSSKDKKDKTKLINKPILNFVNPENDSIKNTRIVYTDGATSNNQESNKAKGGCGVYFGYDTPNNLSIPFNDRPTNNRCELYAIILSIQSNLDFLYSNENNKLVIYTDSQYCMLMINKIKDKPIQMSYANYNMLMLLYFLLKPIREKVIFKHIKAHTNEKDIHSIGNMMADKLAVKATSY